ncbi:voltage-dependent calcium channel beta subunit-associated regulatory protein [Lates japonicus]|uniref:Voltage-dependent calcium channel beta subunit-associated regulatory protein n=1 Tax=Lates japonicus TaxID=270547 RepID=A0AAD3MRF2_LATJO|nr:voltage-dependent calcium channel beta subunit-associated regulatory protein [Lates japonicus]
MPLLKPQIRPLRRCGLLGLLEPQEDGASEKKPPDSQSQLMSPLMKPIPQPRVLIDSRPSTDYSIDEKDRRFFSTKPLRHDPRFGTSRTPPAPPGTGPEFTYGSSGRDTNNTVTQGQALG